MMTFPDGNTWLLIIFGMAGWAWSFIRTLGIKPWQHRAMWEEYAKKHGIPINGKG